MTPERPAHDAYVEHLFTCEAVERGGFCRECDVLLAAADDESWQRAGKRDPQTVAAGA